MPKRHTNARRQAKGDVYQDTIYDYRKEAQRE